MNLSFSFLIYNMNLKIESNVKDKQHISSLKFDCLSVYKNIKVLIFTIFSSMDVLFNPSITLFMI